MAHPPLGELLAGFDAAQRRRGISPRTIRNRRYRIRALARDVEPRHVLDLDTRDLERWLDGLGVSNGSRATYTDNLRAFYRWAAREGHIDTSPAEEIEVPKLGRRLPRPIDDDDLARAFETANPRMRAMLSLMAFEGARCIEVSRLRGEDVDTRAMTVTFHGKGDKERVVPLHPHTLDALRAYRLPKRGYIFVRHWGPGQGTHPIGPEYVSQLVGRHLPDGWSAHKLRHWFGTQFYRASKDLLLTQEVMGHSRPETTAGYARVDTSAAQAIVSRLRVG